MQLKGERARRIREHHAETGRQDNQELAALRPIYSGHHIQRPQHVSVAVIRVRRKGNIGVAPCVASALAAASGSSGAVMAAAGVSTRPRNSAKYSMKAFCTCTDDEHHVESRWRNGCDTRGCIGCVERTGRGVCVQGRPEG